VRGRVLCPRKDSGAFSAEARWGQRPRDATQEKSSFSLWPDKRKPRDAGFQARPPRAPAGTSGGSRATGPPAAALATAMPCWSAAARDSRDMRWLPQRGQRRDSAGVEGNHGERPTRRSANNSARMEKLLRFDRIRGNSPARQIKASNQINNGSVAQSWTGSSAFASSPPCGPATPVSALPPRLRRGRA
jgi:hypothetical protein